jgi:hypothetical protein
MIPKIAKVLRDCVSVETAFVQNDYPYGARLRCKRRNWLEFKAGRTGGFRYVHQTSDPKSSIERWNKPKLGIYTFLSVLVITDEHVTDGSPSAVTTCGLGPNDSENALEAFVGAFGDDFDDNQRKQAEMLKKLIPHHFGSKRNSRLYLVRDAETCEPLFSEPVTGSHPVFAATISTHHESIGPDAPSDLKKYNPPLQYIDEHRRFGLLDSYQSGRRLLVEYVSRPASEIDQAASPFKGET